MAYCNWEFLGRCDITTTTNFYIFAEAHSCTISPPGLTSVTKGGSQKYTINVPTNCSVYTLLIDDTSITPATTYTFSAIAASHRIEVMCKCAKSLPHCVPNNGYFCDNAFAYGDTELCNIPSTADTNRMITDTQFGWVNTMTYSEKVTQNIWAGASYNDLTTGTLVGTAIIDFTTITTVKVTYTFLASPFFFYSELDLYVSTTQIQNVDNTLYGNRCLTSGTTYSYSIPVTCGKTTPVYVVAYATACGDF